MVTPYTLFKVFIKKEAYIQITIWSRFKDLMFYYSSGIFYILNTFWKQLKFS